ncbi:hypothetical protein B0A52_04762 [Exophiala mesophila]|uniref:Xylanolytic transcriptional activator regulatory domain-containing protein n=1 Tax=Exophiala mesophila TaxID=212818 RepID=A0A438N8S1_EXOME|nr:hypothetical protein B0A52_04762 [Exophiala mesophila]
MPPKYTEYQQIFRVGKTGLSNGSPEVRTSKQRPSKEANSKPETHRRTRPLTSDAKVSEAQARLQRLEQIVATLMQPGQNVTTTPGQTLPSCGGISCAVPDAAIGIGRTNHTGRASCPTPTQSKGYLEYGPSETTYLGATHWASILGDIQDIQDCLANDRADDLSAYLDEATFDEDDVILGESRSITLEQACKLLPPRPIADKLLSIYFEARFLHIPFIHKFKFYREYKLFWEEPASMSLLWLSILFSAFHLASWINNVRVKTRDHELHQSPSQQPYHATAAQLLIAGHYQKGRPYSVEAMAIYSLCRCISAAPAPSEPWLLMGVCTRLALKMGYHRDPRNLAHISPFEGEMRRRTFYNVRTLDLLLSFQAGLPTILHEEVCDTEIPANLFDEDFDEDCTELPPSRPDSDHTPMSYYRFKGELALRFGFVARCALKTRVPPYDTIMNADAELRTFIATIPPFLAMKPLCLSMSDEPYLIFQRINIELMYRKNLMILHRNYISYERSNPGYEHSRNTALEASLQVLELQADLDNAAKPGGLLHHDEWVPSSVNYHDFLLAAMIACLDLYESHRQGVYVNIDGSARDTQVRTCRALSIAHGIWLSRVNSDKDALRAATMLGVMFTKFPIPSGALEDLSQENSNFIPSDSQNGSYVSSLEFTDTSKTGSGASHFQEPPDDNAAFEALLKDSELDWGMIDKFIMGLGDGGMDSGLDKST